MGTSGNKIINEKTQQIINYYIFHKKIEKIINKEINPYCINKDIIDIYIINPNWIILWKIYTNYEYVKKEFDKIEDEDEYSLLNKLENKCIEMKTNGIINDSISNFPSSMDNMEFANQFFELQFIKNEVFDYLIDYETYKSFFNIYNPMNLFNNYIIKGKIDGIMIILMMEQNYKIKFIYQTNKEGKIILNQLTADFSLKSKFNTFCDNIKKKSSNDILYFLSKSKIENLLQTSFNDEDKKFYYILKNDNLNIKKYYSTLNKSMKNINFSNINNIHFTKLNNINNPPYLNSVIQNLINIDVLTRFFLNERNFKLIIQIFISCKFTLFYCELLSIMCCSDIEYFDLKDFNEIIYLMDSKFKFNIHCIPGDLIKFFLETINFEFNQLFKNQYKNNNNNININNNIITNYFTYIKGSKTECLNCKSIKIIPINSFSLEFSLDIIFNSYKETNKNIPKNTEGKYIISLDNCFENYTAPLLFNSDNDIICNICKKSAKSKFTNEFYFFPYILIIIVNKEINNNEYVFTFPEILNLESYINIISPNLNKEYLNLKYQLRGIISHYNNSDNQKKYLAFCKHRIKNVWYKYDDLTINKCKNQFKDIINENVDVLIYESFKEYPNLRMNSNNNNCITSTQYDTNQENNNILNFNTNLNTLEENNNININRNTLGQNNNFSNYTQLMLNERIIPTLSSIDNNINENNDNNINNNINNNNNNNKRKNDEDKKKKLFESMKKHFKNTNQSNNENNNNDVQINDIHLSIIKSINSINSSQNKNSNNYNSIKSDSIDYNENKQIELKMDNI